MSVLDELITDRTQEDVEYVMRLQALGLAGRTAEQQAEWEAGLKGAYNATDLNRVDSAMVLLKALLNEIGIKVTLSSNVLTTWMQNSVPTGTSIDEYISDVSSIKTAVHSPVFFPNVPTRSNFLTVDSANNIEKILQMANTEIERIHSAFEICGQSWLYSGGFMLPIGG